MKQENDLRARPRKTITRFQAPEARAFVTRHQWLITQEARTCFEPDRASQWEFTDFLRFIGSHRWVFARTMPQNPHEYTLRRATSGIIFDEAVRFIRQHGFIEYFKGSAYRMLVAEDHKYWDMGSPLGYTILLNRKRLPSAGGPDEIPEPPPTNLPLLSTQREYLRRSDCEGDLIEFERFAQTVCDLGHRRQRSRTTYLDFDGDMFWVVGSAAKADMIWRARMPQKNDSKGVLR